MSLSASFLYVFCDPIIDWFFRDGSISLASIAETKATIKTSLIFIFFIVVIENARYALNGILTAAGDTLFLLLAGTTSLWVFCFIPTYFFVYLPKASIVYAYAIQAFYATAALFIVYLRFAQGKWKTLSITNAEPEYTD